MFFSTQNIAKCKEGSSAFFPVDNLSLSEKSSLKSCLVVGLVAIAMVLMVAIGSYAWHQSDPYTEMVLALAGDRDRGEAIFNINCAGCHGMGGDGSVGPSLHGVSNHRSHWSIIQQVTSGETPPMPKFQPNAQAMADLLSYLEQL
jgi:mono/diheme cytochrome c family protein